MMDSIVLDSSYSPSEKSKQPHCFRGAAESAEVGGLDCLRELRVSA